MIVFVLETVSVQNAKLPSRTSSKKTEIIIFYRSSYLCQNVNVFLLLAIRQKIFLLSKPNFSSAPAENAQESQANQTKASKSNVSNSTIDNMGNVTRHPVFVREMFLECHIQTDLDRQAGYSKALWVRIAQRNSLWEGQRKGAQRGLCLWAMSAFIIRPTCSEHGPDSSGTDVWLVRRLRRPARWQGAKSFTRINIFRSWEKITKNKPRLPLQKGVGCFFNSWGTSKWDILLASCFFCGKLSK